MKEHKLTVDCAEWFYRETLPKGVDRTQTIVCLHGIPTTGHSWRNLMRPLSEAGYRCLAPDWLGCGFSSKPNRRDFDYTPQAYFTALESWLNALELSSVILVVQGYLGAVGVLFALENRDRVERLVILNAPLVSQAKLPWTMQQWGIPLVGEMLTQDPILVDRTLETGSGFVIPDADLTVYRKPFLQTSGAGRSLIAIVKNLNLPMVTQRIETGLKTWEKPTHLLWGISDPWLDSTPVSTLIKPYDHMTWHPFREAKHYPQEHWSAEMSKILISQLSRSR